jgi:hypothetical protein
MPMTASEIERFSLRLQETANPIGDYAGWESPQGARFVEVERSHLMQAPGSRM